MERQHHAAGRILLRRFTFAFSARMWRALLLVALCGATFFPTPASAAPSIWLPTPPGERWKIIQGYGCGTHTGGDLHALDLANTSGRTYDAPVRAAADGTVLIWVAGSGTLILSHGGGFYTQYTHMARATATRPGTAFKRGDTIGIVGDRGAPGVPHLHFMAFTAQGAYASNRKTVPLSFADGPDLPWTGGCNQHGGETVVATGERKAEAASEQAEAPPAAPSIAFSTSAETNHWYNHDVDVQVQGTGTAHGFTTSWNGEPSAQAPTYQTMSAATPKLAEAGEGMHTLRVRGWDAAGNATDASFGPVGYDITPPAAPAPIADVTVAADVTGSVAWAAPQDNASGVAGYKVYVGSDPAGTSDWFVQEPQTATPALAAGSYVVRVQPVDKAGNQGVWTTIGAITSAAPTQ